MTILLLCLFHYLCYGADGFLIINHTRWIIRIINNNSACFFCDSGCKLFHIRHESRRIWRDNNGYAAKIRNIVPVFQEEWCEYDDFVSRIDQDLHRDNQRIRCTNGHRYIFHTERSSKPFIQIIGDCFAGDLISSIAHITVKHHRISRVDDFLHGLIKLCRCRNRRISQAKIVHVLSAEFFPHLFPLFKHSAEGRSRRQETFHFF